LNDKNASREEKRVRAGGQAEEMKTWSCDWRYSRELFLHPEVGSEVDATLNFENSPDEHV